MNDKLNQFLDEHIKPSSNINVVDVFPIRCGIGKSTYIKYRLFKALSTNEKLIVVTDQIERLKEYVSSDELAEYIKRNRNKLTLLTSDNIGTELKTLHLKNIVLMTTQRYFNFTVDEIKELIKSRKIIIFDEKPYFNEQIKINIKTFNNIDTALHIALDNTIEPANKDWLITQWELLRAKFQNTIKEYERLNTKGRLELWHYKPNETISENDEQFIKLINKYRLKLQKYDIESYKNILAIIQMVYEGAIFISCKIKSNSQEQKYENYFTVLIDNKDKMIASGAKVYVLDGTADVSPDYQVSYINMIDCSDFLLPLNKLIINCINISTSRNRFDKTDRNKYIDCIADYIKSMPNKCDTVFTYQKIEPILKKHFDIVDHFGYIKGKNNYRDKTDIVQIGLNRYSDLSYKLQAGYNALEKYKDKNITIAAGKTKSDNVMYNTILADIEQNLYRTKIRNADNTDIVTYTMLFNTNQYKHLVELLKTRYGAYGATINVIDTPKEIKEFNLINRKSKNKTAFQKFSEWHKTQTVSRLMKSRDVRNEIDLTNDQFKDIMKKEEVKQLIIPADKKGYYYIKLNNGG